MVSDNRLVKPVVRGMKVLELLSKQGPLTLDQVASRTKIPRTSVFRLLNTFNVMGYVEQKPIKGIDHWSLGLKLLILINSKHSRLDIRREVRGILEELAERTDEFVQLGVLYQRKVMYIDHVKRPKPLAIYAELGSQLPINISAAGMVLATALKEKELNQLLSEQTFPKKTPNTPTDSNELRKILRKVTRQGFAVDDQQYAIGIRCIAAPILDHNGHVIAAINVTGSLSTVTDERIPALVGQVRSAAEEASKRMGYVASSDNRAQSTKVKVGGIR